MGQYGEKVRKEIKIVLLKMIYYLSVSTIIRRGGELDAHVNAI
jgi:hypothetical protein